ncbi:unnamed protein product, partial [Cladocopium goreaui]
ARARWLRRWWAFLAALLSLKPGLFNFAMDDARSKAEEILRKKVWSVRKKWELLKSYSPEKTEAVLASFVLPKDLAARCHLPEGGSTSHRGIRARPMPKLRPTCARQLPGRGG